MKLLCNQSTAALSKNSKLVIIGCVEDATEVRKYLELKLKVHSNEFILTGLLRMKVDFSR